MEMTDLYIKLNRIFVSVIPMLLGIICHEVAHGYVAYRCGDPTAKLSGRLTLNPIVHIDLWGSITFIVTALAFPFALGWAKPVPVDTRNLRKPRRDMALVAVAGPATNFILAALFMIGFLLTVLVFNENQQSVVYQFFYDMLRTGVFLNLVLCFFNLIPIPPMDGSRLLSMALPRDAARTYNQLERYGMLIILLFLATGLFGKVIIPLVESCYYAMFWAFMQVAQWFA